MFSLLLNRISHCNCRGLFFLFIVLNVSVKGFTQLSSGILSGTVTDGSTGLPLYGAVISTDTFFHRTSSDPNGFFSAVIAPGIYAVAVRAAGFQTRIVTGLKITVATSCRLNIILFPVRESVNGRRTGRDSVAKDDSIVSVDFFQESRLSIYHQQAGGKVISDLIPHSGIRPGNDKDGLELLQRLNGVFADRNFANRNLQSLNLFGLGERYNQVLFNGAVQNSFSTGAKTAAFNAIPIEMIQSVSVQNSANPAIPGDFAGGTVEIITRDFPQHNFFYVAAGGGQSDGSMGRKFLAEKKDVLDFLGLPGTARDLPSGFPTSRSASQFNQKNPQEQVYLSKQLNSHLSPAGSPHQSFNQQFTAGIGRIIQLKGKVKIGMLGVLSQQQAERIEDVSVQVAPNISGNPFPFADQQQMLIRSQSTDINYQYTSSLTGMFNSSVLFGRNKVSLKSFFGSYLEKKISQRSFLSKPDEDTLANSGISYKTEERKYLSLQLSGQHALGKNYHLSLDWLAAYDYLNTENPDERNLLLRQDPADNNRFEIATQSFASLSSADAMFTNSSRLWRNLKEHQFTGRVNILVPFNMLHHAQILSGGIYVQTRSRVFFSDLFLVTGPGYFSLDNLLAPERYFPGGLRIQNYYSNVKIVPGGNYQLNATNRGNYTGSANLGASFLNLDSKLTNTVSFQAGIRVESGSQLVSNTQYNYFPGYRNAQLGTLDENTRVNSLDILPSLNLQYKPLKNLKIHAAYFRTVNRPSMDELSLFRYYDATTFTVQTGNQFLERSRIDNFDAGISWFANSTNSVALSAFSKNIDQPVENMISAYANAVGTLVSIPFNMPSARVQGITAIIKINLNFISAKPLLSGLSFFANANLLKSKVDAGAVKSAVTPFVQEHDLSGTPDYTMNAGMVFSYHRLPELTILYRRCGDYIAMVGSGLSYQLENGNRIQAIPDYRISPRGQIDVQLSQNFLKQRLQLTVGINNLSREAYVEYQDLNGNKRFDQPLFVEKNKNAATGFYRGGIDNTVTAIQSQRNYYCKLSYLF